MNTQTKLPEILVPASGVPNWDGGAWSISFVVSNRGNFVMKGFYGETTAELSRMAREEGLKAVVFHDLHGKTGKWMRGVLKRTIHRSYGVDLQVYRSSGFMNAKERGRYQVRLGTRRDPRSDFKSLKRFPRNWNRIQDLINELSVAGFA